MNRVARRSVTVLVLVAMLLLGFVFFLVEFFINSPSWAASNHSPHLDTKRSNSVVIDRDEILLLNRKDSWIYSTGETIRKSTLHWVGDREGNIQVPTVADNFGDPLQYDMWNGIYAFGGGSSNERVITLTISAQLQNAALEALGDKKGTVAVYNYKTGEILCAVTTPTYDPDDIPDIAGNPQQYEGAYMNRFVQSAYTPGSIFKTVTLAAALDSLPDAQSRTFRCEGRWGDGQYAITCESAHGTQTLQQAFCNSCNCAFAELAGLLGAEQLSQSVAQYGVAEPITFDGLTTAAGSFEKADNAINLGWSAVGQYTDLVNPCSFLVYMGAVAAGGKAPIPYVVESVEDAQVSYHSQTAYTEQRLSPETAELIRRYMRYNVENKYDTDNKYFPGLTVCAKTGTGELDDGKASNAMLSGFVTDEQYPLAFIICVEEGGYGGQTCLPIASRVLTACKEYLNSNPDSL